MAGWCNTCEVQGNRPLQGTPFAHLITPLCRQCVADNIKCPVCKVTPGSGPQEEWFLPPEQEGGAGCTCRFRARASERWGPEWSGIKGIDWE